MSDFLKDWTWEIKNDGDEFKPLKPGIYPAKIRRLDRKSVV